MLLRYDWTCDHCGHTFEQHTTSGTKSLTCPKCTGNATRQPPAPSFVVKGFNAANGYGRKE